MPQVAAFAQVLLFLFGKIVSEIRTAQFRLLADAVYAQDDLPVCGDEREACVELGGHHPVDVECQGDGLVGLVALEHAVECSRLLKHLLGYADLAQCLPVDHVLVVAVDGCLLFAGGLSFHALRRLLHLRVLFGLLLRLLLLRFFLLFLFCHTCVFFFVGTLLFLLFFRADFVVLEELLHCVRLFAFRQVLDCLPVPFVVVVGHAQKAEVCRLLELAPEILDEVFEDARIFVEFQERVLVLPVGRDCLEVSLSVHPAYHSEAGLRVVLVVDHQQFAELLHIRLLFCDGVFGTGCPFRLFLVLFLCHSCCF